MIRICLALGLMLLLGGCAGLFGDMSRTPLDRCAGWTPADYTEADIDVISDRLADWIDAHDTTGETFGCW